MPGENVDERVALDLRGVARHAMGMRIYKIFRASEWHALCDAGTTRGAPVDLADGYIHFSTRAQLLETAEKHFAAESALILAVVEADALGEALRWEPSRGGAKFPHLYDTLKRSDVIAHFPFTRQEGRFVMPEES